MTNYKNKGAWHFQADLAEQGQLLIDNRMQQYTDTEIQNKYTTNKNKEEARWVKYEHWFKSQ